MATYTNEQIAAFVNANLDNPQAIFDAAQQYGITMTDIANATGYSTDQVLQYFSTAMNSGQLSLTNYSQPTTQTAPTTQTTQPTTQPAQQPPEGLYQTVTLSDGSQIYVPGVKDPDAGVEYDTMAALQNAGYIDFKDPGLDYFKETYGADFGSPENYFNWVYGGGSLATDQYGNQYWKTPNGVNNQVNTPLSYEPYNFWDDTMGLLAVGGIAGAGALANSGLLGGVDAGNFGFEFGEGLPSIGGGTSGLSAADIAGLRQMGIDAGLSGAELDAFVNSGGTLGSTAAGGGGVGIGGVGGGSTTGGSVTGGGGATGGLGGATNVVDDVVDGADDAIDLGKPKLDLTDTDPSSWLDTFIKGLTSNLGNLFAGGLSAYGSNQMADAYKDISREYMGIGAPYRDLLLKSYQPGFSLENEPGYKNALDTSTNTFLRAASAGRAPGVGTGGNPFENPNAWAETMKYVTGNVALPYLQNYRGGLNSAGSLGLPQAIQPAMQSVNSMGGAYNAGGFGLGSLFPSDSSQLQNQLLQSYINKLNQPNYSTSFV